MNLPIANVLFTQYYQHMCEIEKILCGLPKNGVVEHYIRYAALLIYITFAIAILAEFVAIPTYESSYKIIGGVFVIVFIAGWLIVSLMHLWTIANLNARIIQLEAANVDLETEL